MKSIRTALLAAAGVVALSLSAQAASSTTVTDTPPFKPTDDHGVHDDLAQRNENPGGGMFRNENPGGGMYKKSKKKKKKK